MVEASKLDASLSHLSHALDRHQNRVCEGKGGPAWQLLLHSATASPAKRSGCMPMYPSGCAGVIEALAACRCLSTDEHFWQ